MEIGKRIEHSPDKGITARVFIDAEKRQDTPLNGGFSIELADPSDQSDSTRGQQVGRCILQGVPYADPSEIAIIESPSPLTGKALDFFNRPA